MARITYRQEFRRCGKAGCTGCREGAGHGPYWYAYWRDDDGRLRSRYCGKTRPDDDSDGTRCMSGSPALRVRLLGGFEVFGGSVPVRQSDWRRASARKLLALLLLWPGGLTREQAVDHLWPDAMVDQGLRALSVSLSALRACLDSIGVDGGSRLPPKQRYLRMGVTDSDDIDLRRLLNATHPERMPVAELKAIVDLCTGELLPEYAYEEWTMSSREMARCQWRALALHLCERLRSQGEGETAQRYMQVLVLDDGTDEEAARLLMRILCDSGQTARALQVYKALERSLHDDLGAEPDSPTRLLAARLRPVDQGSSISARPGSSRFPHNALAFPMSSDDEGVAELDAEASRLLMRGQPEEALGMISRARTMARRSDEQQQEAHLLLTEAAIYDRMGQYSLADYAAERALQQAQRLHGEPARALSLRMQAKIAQHRGDLQAALDLARTSAELFERIGYRDETLRSRRVLAHCLWASGKLSDALAAHATNLETAALLGGLEHTAYVTCGLGSTHLLLGNIEAAEAHLHQSLALAKRLDDHFLAMSVEYYLANLWYERAYLAELHDHQQHEEYREEVRLRFQHVIEVGKEQSISMRVVAQADYASALAKWGYQDGARQVLEDAEQAVRAIPQAGPEPAWLLMSASELSSIQGNLTQALDQAALAVDLLQRTSPTGLPQAHRIFAHALMQAGNPAAAVEQWSASLRAAAMTGQQLETLRTRKSVRALHGAV